LPLDYSRPDSSYDADNRDGFTTCENRISKRKKNITKGKGNRNEQQCNLLSELNKRGFTIVRKGEEKVNKDRKYAKLSEKIKENKEDEKAAKKNHGRNQKRKPKKGEKLKEKKTTDQTVQNLAESFR
jgi:hypothetical protein